MKKRFYFLLFPFASIGIVVAAWMGLLLLGSCDIVQQTEMSVRKYPWMLPFFEADGVFVSGTLDVDINILKCRFKGIESQELLLDELTKTDWKLVMRDDNGMLFERETGYARTPVDCLFITFYNDYICDIVVQPKRKNLK